MTGGFPLWLVPTETSSVSVTQTASLPAMFDYGPVAGDPDIASAAERQRSAVRDDRVVQLHARPAARVTAGIWDAGPTECGPYAAPAPGGHRHHRR